MSKQSKRQERQEAQKRREHQLGHEYGGSSQPCFGELQQISKNAPLRNRLQMCLGNYDEAQRTMNAFGLKSVVGTETVPTTPGVDVKHDIFSSKTMLSSNLNYSQVRGDVKDKASSLSKLTTSTSYPKPKKHEAGSSLQSNGIAPSHQRPSYQQLQQPSRSSVSPKNLSAVSSSQVPDTTNTRQVSPVRSKQHVKPVVPRPPSRQDNQPKEKKEKAHHHHHHHHHVGKEKRPDKERIKLQQEKAHQKPPKLLNKPAPVKNDHPSSSSSSSYEDPQVKRIEPNSLNKTLGSGRPIIPSMPPFKSPHNSMIGKDSNIGVVSSGATVTAKLVPTKAPKPLPSPTVRTSFTSELFSEPWRSPNKERPDKNVVNAPLEVNMAPEKKAKEKKLKKKKHKQKTSELTRETERLPPPVEEFTSEPKVQPHIPNKKPMAIKPPSLDLSNSNSASGSVTLKPPSKLLSPLLSPMEDSSQDTYLQKILDEMAGPTSPFLPVIQTPYKTGSFTFGFPHISKSKDEVFASSTTEAVPVSQQQQQQQQEVKQESGEIDYWNPRVSDISEADITSVKQNPFMDDMEQELLHGVSFPQGGPQEDHESSSSESSDSDSESEDELLLSAKSDFPDMDSIEDINFDVPIDTITPLRSNPSSFSFIMEPDNHAQLEPPTHSIEPMSHFVMAPNLGVHADTKTDNVDTDSNSSGSEDGDSSSDEGSSDSDMDNVEDLFVAPSTTTMDHTRSQLLVMSNAAEATTANNVTTSVAITGPTGPSVVNRPPAAMKRLRNMFAAVKPTEITTSSGGSTTANATAVQPLHHEAVTPVTPVSMTTASFDTKVITSTGVNKQQPLATVTATTVTSEITDSSTSRLLPRKSNTKRMTSVSGKPDSKNSMLSEESSSDSEGEESGEVTNSESEEEGTTKPKPPKQAKWDNTLTTVETPETSKLQLICSVPRQYMRTVHTPASTPKSPPTARIRPIMVAPEKKFRDRSDSTSEEHAGRTAYPQQPRDSLYHRRSRSREDSHEPDYPPRNRDHMRPHGRRNSRSMRSSSPDHHHHHSTSRHRELPPPRGSSHWNHGWSNSGDHHYSYDYDYGSTSHHYSRRSRHSARLAKPEIYMEDARKLKHTGDRTSSEIEKAHYYLDAALTYMTYCVTKEEEGDPDKEVMSTTIRLLKYIVQSQSPGLNMLARDDYCEMLSALCLRSQSVLSMKLFNTLSSNESINRNQKILSEYFSTTKNNPQGRRSPFVGVSPSYSPANMNTTGGSCGSGVNSMLDYASPSCHSPSSANVTIPSHIYNMAATQFSVTSHLFNSQETWRHANNITEQHRDFFDTLDRRSGPISLYSSMLTVADWAKEGLRLLKSTRGTGSCRDY